MNPDDDGLTVFDSPELLELMAEQAHKSWSGWVKWMLEHMDDIAVDIPYIERWQRQMRTPYAELSEAEKESDRIEARAFLAVMRNWFMAEDGYDDEPA